MNIGNFSPLKVDELLYSWIVRESEINAEKKTQFPARRFLERISPDSIGSKSIGRLRMDCILDLCEFSSQMRSGGYMFPEPEDILLRHTLFGILSIARTEAENTYVSTCYLRSKQDPLALDKPISDITDLKFCPKCGAYWHVTHQAPGVCVCVKHRVPLMQVTSKINTRKEYGTVLSEMEHSSPVYVEDIDKAIQFAAFIEGLYQSGRSFSKEVIDQLIPEQSSGYSGSEFIRTVWLLLDRFENYEAFEKETLKIPAVATILPDHLERIPLMHAALQKHITSVHTDHNKILSDVSPLFQVRCKKCGKAFVTHRSAWAYGYGCPNCDSKGSEELVKEQLQKKGFELFGRYQGYSTPVKCRCMSCGKTETVAPYDRIWEEKQCFCRRVKPNEYYEKDFPKEFQLVSVVKKGNGKKKTVSIQHNVCGKIFRVILQSFLDNPVCRCCQTKFCDGADIKNIYKATKNLAKDSYVITKFAGLTTEMTLKHKYCGTETKMLPYSFERGTRCKLCSIVCNPEYLDKLLSIHAPGCCVIKSLPKGRVTVKLADDRRLTNNIQYFIQELSRPTPSKVFPERTSQATELISDRGRAFVTIKELCDEKGICSVKKVGEKLSFDSGKTHNLMKSLERSRYIEKMRPGTVRIINHD